MSEDEKYIDELERHIDELEDKIMELKTDLDNLYGVLDAVERAVRKGNANYDIEEAYKKYACN